MTTALVFIVLYTAWTLFLLRPYVPPTSHKQTNNLNYSVVIPFRNDTSDLKNNLFLWKNILPKPTEIILVNDHSETPFNNLIAEFNSLPLSIINNPGTGKKQALKAGYLSANCPIILSTDADACWNSSGIQKMLTPLSNPNTLLCCGEVHLNYPENAGPIYNILKTDYNALTKTAKAGFAWGIPFLCSGAAIAFRKSALPNSLHGEIADSGDDVFLLHSFIEKHGKQSVVWVPNAVIVQEKKGLLLALNQRLRWAGKSIHYQNKSAIAISIAIPIIHTLALVSILLGHAWILPIKIIADLFVMKNRPIFSTLFCSLFYLIYLPLIPFLSLSVPVKWKQRKLRI
jgi:biofilm PGA synthesis N-glycosyltransferase PgaC